MAQIFKLPLPSGPNDYYQLERENIDNSHPVAIAHDIYAGALADKNRAPSIIDILKASNSHLSDYAMFLEPQMNQGVPDCRIILRGEKIPGNFDPESASGRSYSEYLRLETNENPVIRLQEIFGSLVMHQISMSKSRSPYKTHLRVTLFCGIFPIWNSTARKLWAALVCAPKFVELPILNSSCDTDEKAVVDRKVC